MKTNSLSLFFLITHEDENSLNLLELSGDKLCELVSIRKKLTAIFEVINSTAALCYYNDLGIAKKNRDKLQKDYKKEIMIFNLLIKTESMLID